MAVYGLGLVIRLLQELEKRDFQTRTDEFQDWPVSKPPTITRGIDAESLAELLGLEAVPKRKKRKKRSAYHSRYSKAFKRLSPKFKKKNGSWKKNGFKNCAKAARKAAKK